METKDVVCLIPARGGSKGVRKKNIKPINDKPLIDWTIKEAKKSKYISDIYVSSEDDEILSISKQFGAEIVKRDEKLALDTTSTMDVVIDFIEQLKKQNIQFKHLLLLQCTSPLRTISHIDEAIELYLNNLNTYDSLISIVEQEEHPYLSREIDNNGTLRDFMEFDKSIYYRRQDYPKVYHINGAIYMAKVETLMDEKTFETKRTYGYTMDKVSSIDIDDELDFEVAEYLLRNLNDLP